MKKRISLLYILPMVIMVMGCKTEEKNNPDISSTFKDDLKTHLNAIQNRDFDALEPTVADDVLMIGPDGSKLESKKDFMEFHKEWFKQSNWNWKGTVLKTESSDSLGYGLVQYNYTETDTIGNTIYESNAHLILVFKNNKDGWQLVHDQNTRIQNQGNQ